MHRFAAALIAVAAWAGLATRISVSYLGNGDLVLTLWLLGRFFTILTALLVAVTMTALAAGRRVSAFTLGGVTLASILVWVVYVTLLRHDLNGGAYVANVLLHYVLPAGMAAYWLLLGQKIGLDWRHPFAWMLYPLAYFIYALLRGSVEGRYPYPFMNLDKLGLGRVLLNGLGIAVAFLLAGLAMVAIARRFRRVRPSQRLG